MHVLAAEALRQGWNSPATQDLAPRRSDSSGSSAIDRLLHHARKTSASFFRPKSTGIGSVPQVQFLGTPPLRSGRKRCSRLFRRKGLRQKAAIVAVEFDGENYASADNIGADAYDAD